MAEVLYANISAENEPCVMESVCVSCEKSGKTTILLTKIPMFSDIIIVSFECEECGYKNNEVQFGGKIKENGVIITFNAKSMEDLSRQVVRSENCTVKIPELELELPSNKKGTINTLEGFLQNMVDDLGQEQPVRKIMQPELSEKIDQIIQSLTKYKSGENFPFKFILHDPSGNSYIQNTHYPNSDPQLKFQHYQRTIEETEAMGYSIENQKQEIQQEEPVKITQVDNNQVFDGNEEIQAQNRNFNVGMENSVKGESLVFPTQCNACQQMGENKMCSISIPHFKDIIIMAFNCPFCGNRDTEVKSGGSITPKGKRITLYVKDPIDIRRDVFKSETAGLYIPEIDLELQCGTLGGVYSTVEGLISQILSHLRDNNPFIGDGAEGSFRDKMSDIFGRLEAYQTGNEKFTLIIKDLVDNSFLSNPYHPEKDPNAFAEEFERTQEDNDELGIDTMKTDNYQ